MLLNKQELCDLTQRRTKSGQVRVLRFMGIEHRIRPDGSVAVLKSHVEQTLGAKDIQERKIAQAQPNWSAI